MRFLPSSSLLFTAEVEISSVLATLLVDSPSW
jgi:hypothetical protein